MLRIKKLTPPQIAALCEALPNCVEAGILQTTNSIATFRTVAGKEPWQPHHVRRLLVDIVNRDGDPERCPLVKVVEKLERRPDLVEVTD